MRTAKTVQAQLDGAEIEWTTNQAAAYLQMSPNLLYLLCHRRQIPHRKINLPGRERPLFRFTKSAIDEWREKHSEVVTV